MLGMVPSNTIILDSGHGGYIHDDDIDEEADGYDETLVPVDFARSGQICNNTL